jgi:hypothetical protein
VPRPSLSASRRLSTTEFPFDIPVLPNGDRSRDSPSKTGRRIVG